MYENINMKLFTKDTKTAKQQSSGLRDLESDNLRDGAQRSGSDRTIAN